MKSKRLRNYLEARKNTRLAGRDESIRTDRKTDQDFPGYPYGTSTEEHITPENTIQRKLASVHEKDGEKILDGRANLKRGKNEIESDGSGGAFEGTEEVRE